MTKKRKYEKPSMEVFECEQQQQLLAGSDKSGPLSNPDDYESGDDPFLF